MKNIYFLSFTLLLSFNSFSQDSELLGVWYLQYLNIGGTIHNLPENITGDSTSSFPYFNFTDDCDDTQCYIVSGSGTYSSLNGYYTTNDNILTFESLFQSLGGCTTPYAEVCIYEGTYFSNVIYDTPSQTSSPHTYTINGTGNDATFILTDFEGDFAVYGTQTLSNHEFHIINDLTIYPNPVRNILNIDLKDYNNEVTYSIYNSIGKVIINNLDLKGNIINVGFLDSGLYFLKFEFEKKIKFLKFIKQ